MEVTNKFRVRGNLEARQWPATWRVRETDLPVQNNRVHILFTMLHRYEHLSVYLTPVEARTLGLQLSLYGEQEQKIVGETKT